MKRPGRVAAVALGIATMTMWVMAPVARADDPVMDEDIRPIWPETADGFTEGALDSNPELDPCPTNYPYPPTNANVVYTYFGFQGQQTPIYLDEYDPIAVAATTPVPAIVLVHGGGWFQGCKSKESGVANAFAKKGYLVFAIDYRLACIDNDNPTPEEAPLCHWPFTRPDPDPGGPKGAAIHDVQFAVSWIRSHASTYHLFNNRVGMAGSSAGANLAFQAAGTLGTGDPRRPQVVAGWSSLTELGKMTNDHFSCDDSPDTNYCLERRPARSEQL